MKHAFCLGLMLIGCGGGGVGSDSYVDGAASPLTVKLVTYHADDALTKERAKNKRGRR